MKNVWCFPIILFFLLLSSCSFAGGSLKLGAERTDKYLPLLEGKSVALVVNQTSKVDSVHLVDFMLGNGVDVKKIFAPEHGFRGHADAGEFVKGGKDKKSGLPIVSLYGKNKKPSKEHLKDVEVIVFDIQDVGARFYTYISTLHYVMEAAEESGVKVVVLDRPNPNDKLVDGPVLDLKHKSFVGMHPIPVIHGLTVGELALMISEENWLDADQGELDLTVIPMEGYTHGQEYSLPEKPSPNLPNDQSIALYPSLCFFEGTVVSVGRGTFSPFTMYGYPSQNFGAFQFTPKSINGMSKYPKHENKQCFGVDLSNESIEGLNLSYLLDAYQKYDGKKPFFNSFFENLAGTSELRTQIENGWSEIEIKNSWKPELSTYKKLRQKYLLYSELK
ncbi:exo-beta-N-acetylmuramidase NamZ family protein [Aureibacter tunicatorum]|uniref:Uncharacterized protein YbbC (DUF1343 family) n=1 Tax=Aureibacter tunicatorum TaxID=866807 RepID=A0AAE4BUC2_9BACT|nr:DUF1343 domain-containing protein [Aureibacter tunicatorum]MDR6240910.1 uncharacterized protein YbbC (DUF1343 family) [Aureibacter tunicatorum]BDD03690.1 hypothetical protein AUTU_11730 [Aureibacter tunicatorum]